MTAIQANTGPEPPEILSHLVAIIRCSNDSIISRDLDGIVRSWNPAAERMYGYSAKEMVGQSIAMLIPPGQLDEGTWLLDQIRQGNAVEAFETMRTHKDGRSIFVSLTVSPIIDGAGVIIGASQIGRDITEHMQAAASVIRIDELDQRIKDRTRQLEAANQSLERYADSVAHDLRRPLRHIVSYSEILLEEAVPVLSVEHAGLLNKIFISGQRMGELIDKLLEFSRSAQGPFVHFKVDLNAVVEAARQEVLPDAGTHVIDWRIGVMPVVLGDPILLKQVMVNLLSNSVKYSRQRAPAVIEVGSREDELETVCFVRDNGVGFDPNHAGKLFGVFERLHHADEFEGTGIGLAHVHRIIQRHGGKVWAEAVLGQGAMFSFSLPKKAPETGT